MAIHIDLTQIRNVINPHFYDLLWDIHRYLVMYGGAGSGKSVFAAEKVLIRILTDLDTDIKHRVLVLRKTSPSARESVYKLIKSLISDWNLDNIVHPNKTDMTFTFINGSEILIRGLDDPGKIKSIYDITSIWMEEASEFTEDDFNELDRRLRGDQKTYLQIMMTFNPVSKLSWLYKTFVQDINPMARIHHSTFKNNMFLGDSQVYKSILERYQSTKNKHQYKVYYLGEWGSLEGLIYTNWSEFDEWPVCDTIVYGLDFGFGSDELAIVKVGAKENAFYVEELLYACEMTNEKLIPWLIAKGLAGEARIYCDCSSPDRIASLRASGIRALPCKKGQGSVQAGIDFIQGKDLYVKGKNLLNEIQDYTYKKDRFGNSMGEPKDGRDHMLDAMRYAIFTYFAHKMDLTLITSGD